MSANGIFRFAENLFLEIENETNISIKWGIFHHVHGEISNQ